MSKKPNSPAPGSRVSDYEYELAPDRIARYPADRRDQSRLLVLNRDETPIQHRTFSDLTSLVSAGDVLVVNESRVLPVRLLGSKPTGAPAEVFLLRPLGTGPEGKDWEALVRPGGKLKPGRTVVVSPELEVKILDSAPEGGRIVRLMTDLSAEEALERFGHMPLPPYIDREDESIDRERYQTVYAKTPGSVAAPTAGLHFTDTLLDEIALRGVEIARISLDVGIGTFRPVEVPDPADHQMHAESFLIPAAAAEAVNRCRIAGRKVWAVGTTVVRTLESSAGPDGRVRPGPGQTRLFIRPPYRFRVVDRLITNFHLPRSTLLMLVAAFGGYHPVMEAYHLAIEEGYRFYSYGDAMVVV
ncbi:MAG: tRNA preQ1(34) S-adenosylmethionine ribosyltransferase-isomerase QueA [Gemmatimonadetes bacterium]|nr:tRNA preQ1(34) S-adenosylmethionine ribosyltransferase-isomerase QueA [Gemmatimonadota bacterium]NNM04630.1 tRNA preQ1(34) S-adenosylmethionine ribosyltransferase-isomerase QueA [Gemmatimonadota bacterium]